VIDTRNACSRNAQSKPERPAAIAAHA
jgi:hypothetical protein